MKNLIKAIGLVFILGLITEQVQATVPPPPPTYGYKLWIKDGRKYLCKGKGFYSYKQLVDYVSNQTDISMTDLTRIDMVMRSTRTLLITTEVNAFYIELFEVEKMKLKPISNKRWKEIQNLNK